MNIASNSKINFAEFCVQVGEEYQADLIEGIVYISPPDKPVTNLLMQWLLCIMHLFVERRELGEVYFGKVAYRLDDYNAPEPDIGFVSNDRCHLIKDEYVDGPPDLALEIATLESRKRDYVTKRDQYERFGVNEYWIVDEVDQNVTLLYRENKGKFSEVDPICGMLNSRVMPGFYLRPEWCWQDPEPDEVALFKEMVEQII